MNFIFHNSFLDDVFSEDTKKLKNTVKQKFFQPFNPKSGRITEILG